MCGRFALTITARFFERFELPEDSIARTSRLNISPGQPAPVIFDLEGRRVVEMQWGLVPSWAKDVKIGSKMFNARSETLDEKPSFRILLKRKRCLIPASGFYEWKKEDGRVPYVIKVRNQDYFAMAGLYDVWQGGDGSVLSTFTIVTTAAAKAMADLHDRMPVIVAHDMEAEWIAPGELDGTLVDEILRTYSGSLSIAPAPSEMSRPEPKVVPGQQRLI
ncbi:MAG TPA: SOS response-associated peptidase [Methanomassiliicoccales archaeon]